MSKKNFENQSEVAQKILEEVKSAAGDLILSSVVNLGHAEVRLVPENLKEFFQLLADKSKLNFSLLLNVTAVDYMDEEFVERPDTRYEVVYHFLNIPKTQRLRVKVAVPEDRPEVASACEYWLGANFMESEVWDMYGITFEGHPELRRVLMYDEFKGHPLRKDYPVQGKQPRIPLLSPEVENTARHMQRPGLVQINSKQNEAGSSSKSDQQEGGVA